MSTHFLPTTKLTRACEYGDMNIILKLIELNPYNWIDWNSGLYKACKHGHENVAKLMLSKGAKIVNSGLQVACRNGHENLVKLMIFHGANEWNWGIIDACIGNNITLVRFMLQKGADIRYCSGLCLDDLIYLVKTGVTDFGHYTFLVDKYKAWKEGIKNKLNISLNSDLNSIMSDYY